MNKEYIELKAQHTKAGKIDVSSTLFQQGKTPVTIEYTTTNPHKRIEYTLNYCLREGIQPILIGDLKPEEIGSDLSGFSTYRRGPSILAGPLLFDQYIIQQFAKKLTLLALTAGNSEVKGS